MENQQPSQTHSDFETLLAEGRDMADYSELPEHSSLFILNRILVILFLIGIVTGLVGFIIVLIREKKKQSRKKFAILAAVGAGLAACSFIAYTLIYFFIPSSIGL